MRKIIVISFVVSLMLLIGAGDAPKPVPAAFREHENAVLAAGRQYTLAVIAAKEIYIKTLDAELDKATQAKQLDRALAIRDERDHIKQEIERIRGEVGGPPKKPPQVVVLAAKYGNGDRWSDVTSNVQALFDGNRAVLPSQMWVAFKTDPLPRRPKVLDIELSLDGHTMLLRIPD